MTYHRVSGSWGESGIYRSDLSDGALSRSTPMPSLLVTNTRAGLGWAGRLGWLGGWDCYIVIQKAESLGGEAEERGTHELGFGV